MVRIHSTGWMGDGMTLFHFLTLTLGIRKLSDLYNMDIDGTDNKIMYMSDSLPLGSFDLH